MNKNDGKAKTLNDLARMPDKGVGQTTSSAPKGVPSVKVDNHGKPVHTGLPQSVKR